MELKKIIYFAATHWDREWYKTFQGFRFRLIDVMDEIIDKLEKTPEFSVFHLDGQTSLLEDYIRIRPENEERLKKLIIDRRLLIGPWYTMSDEFLVSAESLIQNLSTGHSIAEKWGAQPMKYGYCCDIFGHVANMPQILNGFGIKGALVGRGTNDHNTPPHFRWVAPDGSAVTTFKVPEMVGYGTFFYEVVADYLTDGDKKTLVDRAVGYVNRELARSSAPYVVLMDAMDHERIHDVAPYLCSELEKIFHCPAVIGSVSDLPELLKDTPLKEIRGELNQLVKAHVEHNMLIPHTASSRYDLKYANDLCQHRLERYAAPMTAMSEKIPTRFLDNAYAHLLKNHAHDSICGCSIDGVHRDMQYRYRQSNNIAEEISYSYFRNALSACEPPEDGRQTLALYNPLPFPVTRTVEVPIDFDPQFPERDDPWIKYAQRNKFRLFDKRGKEIKYTLSSVERNQYTTSLTGMYNEKADPHRAVFTVDLNPMGLTLIDAVPSRTPIRFAERMSTGDFSAENDYMTLSIESDGTINIHDKISGKSYTRLNYFIDDPEAGDGWFHISPIRNNRRTSLGSAKDIQKVFDGTDACTFRITTYMTVGNYLDDPDEVNGQTLRITTDITLKKSDKFITVQTRIRNNANNHRLRLALPCPTGNDDYLCTQTGALIERQKNIQDTHDWKESDIPEQSFEHTVIKRDANQNGIAFLSAGGMHEVSSQYGGIYITLYRAFGKTFLTNGEPDGQLKEDLTFDYALMPLNDKVSNDEAIHTQARFASPPLAITLRPNQTVNETRFLELSNTDITFVTMRPTPDGAVLLRLQNPTGSTKSDKLTFSKPVKHAKKTDFLGTETATLPVRANTLSLSLKPYEIATLTIELA